MSRQSFGVTKSIANITNAAPAGAQGLSLDAFKGSMKPRKWLLRVTITVADGDVWLWGQRTDLDTDDTDDHANGIWGLHNDVYGRFVDGKLAPGTAKLKIGTHHFVVEDLGHYVGVGLQTDGTCTASGELTEILEGSRSG